MSTPSQAEVRRMIAAAGTIVVKVGSSSLTQPSGHLDPDKLDALAAALAQVRLMGGRVVLGLVRCYRRRFRASGL